jgi:hypothetical protein
MPSERQQLEKSWGITRTLLARAKGRLPIPTAIDSKVEFDKAIAEYEDMLSRNELELALDALAAAGDLAAPRGGFWRDLERAAENMHLHARASHLRRKFQETLCRS